MTDAWTAAGDRWEAALAAVIAALKEGNPDLWTQVGHDRSEFFPLRAWASLGAGGTPNEDLVISVDFAWVEGGGVEYRADIASGGGRILAETAVGGSIARTVSACQRRLRWRETSLRPS